MEDISVTAYAQWVVINISNSSKRAVVIKNVHLPWGKFYKGDNKDAEIPIGDIENKTIEPHKKFRISSCGREGAPSGTEGEFDIYDGDDKVRHFYWNCPWGSKTNTWSITDRNSKWVVDSAGGNLDSGALGTITVELLKTH